MTGVVGDVSNFIMFVIKATNAPSTSQSRWHYHADQTV